MPASPAASQQPTPIRPIEQRGPGVEPLASGEPANVVDLDVQGGRAVIVHVEPLTGAVRRVDESP